MKVDNPKGLGMFLGHTRFSLYSPSSGAWVASRGKAFETAEQYRAYLYSGERLGLRLDIFLGITVPMLEIAAAGRLMAHVVSYSESLPARFERALQEAVDRYGFLVLDRVPDGGSPANNYRRASAIMAAAGHENTCTFGVYRLDDDDVLSADFFDQMVPHLIPEKAGHVVSLGRGITAIYVDGVFYNARDAYWPMHSKGMLNVCRYDEAGALIAPVSSAHPLADRFNPVILDSRKISHVWTRHLTQDTSLLPGRDPTSRMLAEMSQYQELDPAVKVDEIFPVLAGKILTSMPTII